mmetsp:Transcript_8894/g.6238  ORF Transcript_8894/g.6238 Transcript_8894/m.6238 type:complete len:98 (+) Transcript_8894:490-783(+)
MKTINVSIQKGIVMGGGVGLTWHNPIQIVTDNTLWAMPESNIGFFCDVGATYLLSHIIPPGYNQPNLSLGLYIGMTGARLKAIDLIKLGLATHYVPL